MLLATCALIPFFCCLAPPCAIRIQYGNFPTGGYADMKVSEGMSKAQVLSILGTPHERFANDRAETWYYWADSFGVTFSRIYFDPEGRVTHTSRD